MIDSIANSLDMNIPQSTKTAQSERTEKMEKAESVDAASKSARPERARETAPRKNDRVELSSDARDYLAAEKSGKISAKSEVTAKNSTGESAVNLNISSDENISSSDLYSYTESELLDLVLNGDISRSDYNAELSKREESD